MNGVFETCPYAQNRSTALEPVSCIAVDDPFAYVRHMHTMKGWGSSGTNRIRPGSTFADNVRMPEAIPVFDDPYALTITDDESDPSEQRFVTIGMGAAAACLWLSSRIAVRTFESFLYVPTNLMNAKSTRHVNERSVRFQ